MLLTVQHDAKVLVQADTDEQWVEVARLNPLNVLSRHPLYYRIMISDGMKLEHAHKAISWEVENLTKDLAQYVTEEEYRGFVRDQLKALYGRKEMWTL